MKGTVAEPGQGAAPNFTTPTIPTIVAAMGVTAILGITSFAIKAGVTQVDVHTSRVTHDKYAVNEANANTTI